LDQKTLPNRNVELGWIGLDVDVHRCPIASPTEFTGYRSPFSNATQVKARELCLSPSSTQLLTFRRVS